MHKQQRLELKFRYVSTFPEKKKSLDTALTKYKIIKHHDAGLAEIKILSHKIAGSAASYGFPELSEQAARLKNVIKQATRVHDSGNDLVDKYCLKISAMLDDEYKKYIAGRS